jgi:hypothetical protein
VIAGKLTNEVWRQPFTVLLLLSVRQSDQSVSPPFAKSSPFPRPGVLLRGEFPFTCNNSMINKTKFPNISNTSRRLPNPIRILALDLLGRFHRRRRRTNSRLPLPNRNIPPQDSRQESRPSAQRNRQHVPAHRTRDTRPVFCPESQ